MEFWPKKKVAPEQKPLVLAESFDPEGFTAEERARHPRNLDAITSPEEFLNAVDFDTVNDIFDTMARKSAGERPVRSSGHRISKDQISFMNPDSIEGPNRLLAGNADVVTGKITMQWWEGAKSNPVQTIFMLKTLLHEAAHVRSGYKRKVWRLHKGEDGKERIEVATHSGLSENSLIATTPLPENLTTGDYETHEYGTSLNEAITENISHEALYEYLTRTGNSGYISEENQELKKDLAIIPTYTKDRILLGMVTDTLARRLEVPRDEVWKGFVQAYMSGNTGLYSLLNDLDEALEEDPDIQRLVSQFSGEALSNSELSTKELIELMDNESMRLPVLTRVVHALSIEHLQNVLGLR